MDPRVTQLTFSSYLSVNIQIMQIEQRCNVLATSSLVLKLKLIHQRIKNYEGVQDISVADNISWKNTIFEESMLRYVDIIVRGEI